MSDWIKCVLREAVRHMQESAQEDLAVGLARLGESPLITDARMFLNAKLDDVADEVLDAEGIKDLQRSLVKIADEFEADHCTVHMIREAGQATYDKKSVSTHKISWTKEYVNARLGSIDPIIRRCRADMSSFFWNQISASDPFTKHYFQVAQKHGVGPSGYTAPLANIYGDLVAVSLSSNAERYAFESKFLRKQSDFDDIAPLLVEVYTELVGIGHHKNLRLTDDHLRVLYKLASGASVEEVSAGTFMFGSFKNIEKSILQIFCAKSLTQAAVIATELGALRNLPYFENEMLSLEESQDSQILNGEFLSCTKM